MAESALRSAVKRIQAELDKVAAATIRFPKIDVYVDDIALVFAAMKRWGGRHDWTPTRENVERLPPPVRFHIVDLQIRIELLQRELIRAGSEARRRDEIIAELRHPPR
ncbi:MAG TPA: hypothetical protein VGF77_08570 [Allosphingosinicella sp.]|jgi:hypothetical protein